MSETDVGVVGGAFWTRVFVRPRLPSLSIAEPLAEVLATGLVAAMLLSVAIWNGFPITFYDTGAYILQGLADYFVPERAPVYSYFLRFLGARQSLWWVAGAQAAIAAFVIVEFCRCQAPRLSLYQLLGIGALLSMFTGIGWVVGEIEPDCFAAIVVLTIWLLAFRSRELGPLRSSLLVAVGALATAAHPSHLGLAGCLILALALFTAVARLRGRAASPAASLFLPTLSFALGILLIASANYALTKRIFLSRSGSVFMTARMIEDGVAKRVLDDTCPGSHFLLCRFKDHLPATADDYLWEPNSPFNRLGRFRGSARESQALMMEGFERYPLVELSAMLRNGARQFFMFRTGDGVGPQERVLDTEFRNFLPRQMKSYSTARQQRETFSFALLNVVHVGLAALALIGLAFMAWRHFRQGHGKDMTLPVFVLLALAANALVCGAISGPHDRYQGRLIWISVLALAVTARPEPVALRRKVESGT